MLNFITLLHETPWLFYSLVALMGMVIGSFLNAMIYRLPLRMMSAWRAECIEFLQTDEELRLAESHPLISKLQAAPPLPSRSRCPTCQHLLGFRDLVPVLSYLLLGGHCRYCGQGISYRYPLIEFSTALGTIGLAILAGPSVTFAWSCVLFYLLMTLSMIDFDHQLLPDDLTYATLWIGLMHAFIQGDLHSAVLGTFLGYGLLWGIRALYWLITKKEGMGLGDAKLLAALGAWCGASQLLPILLLASVLGLLIAGPWTLMKRSTQHPVPFGPFLALAGMVSYLFGTSLLDWYWHFWTVTRI